MLVKKRKNRTIMSEEEILDGKNRDIGQVPYHEVKRINKTKKIMRENFLRTYIATGGDVKVSKEASGYSPSTNVEYNPDVKKDLSLARQKLWQKFGEYADEAFETQLEIMRSDKCSFKVKLDVTNSILDRAGYKPAERREVIGSVGVTGDTREIGAFAERARKLLADKMLKDVEAEVEDAVVLDSKDNS